MLGCPDHGKVRDTFVCVCTVLQKKKLQARELMQSKCHMSSRLGMGVLSPNTTEWAEYNFLCII